VAGWGIFLVLLAIYHVNGDFLYGNDAKPNVYLPAALLKWGSLSFTPSRHPFMFFWGYRTGQDQMTIDNSLRQWDDRVPGQPYTYRQLSQAGRLSLMGPKYYVVPSIRETAEGEPIFVNTFGPGAGLTALPLYTLLHAVLGGDLQSHPAALWYGGKFVAAVLVAGSAVFVFLTACAFTTVGRAVLIALAYGLGTGVWSVSSQALWQHGPNGFFLAMGTYFLVRAEASWRQAAWCGLAYSAAVACRPTGVIVAGAAGIYLLVRWVTVRRKALVPYVLAALPIAAALAAYNTYYLGSPWEFGQAKMGHQVALGKTGSEALWQTPLGVGLAGLMISPSRGLLVFSPFMVFALAGLGMLWTQRRYAPLWPVAAATLALLVVAFKWFDWWGGWCYGPRPIVDTMPFFALMLIPIMDWVWRRKRVLALFLVLAAWSVGVQVLGVFAYDMFGWNRGDMTQVYLEGRVDPVIVETAAELERLCQSGLVRQVNPINLDIDLPEHRHRLWSLSDNQILYYLKHFKEARDTRMRAVKLWLWDPSG
jgi:hypothetical protein